MLSRENVNKISTIFGGVNTIWQDNNEMTIEYRIRIDE
jgi:hypothetical protein